VILLICPMNICSTTVTVCYIGLTISKKSVHWITQPLARNRIMQPTLFSNLLQWRSKYQTPKSDAFQKIWVPFSLNSVHLKTRQVQYSDHSKTGTLMVMNRTHFVSGFWMVFYHSISGPVFKWSTRLDHFIQKKNVFMVLSHLKWSNLVNHLKTGHKCPVIKWLGQQYFFTIPKPDWTFFLPSCFIQKEKCFIFISKMV
jgi:hypothetical protein